MINKILKWLGEVNVDQITFRKVGHGSTAHLNIQVEEMNNFNQSGYVQVTQAQLDDFEQKSSVDDIVLEALRNNYNYSLNDKSQFNAEVCPNCGAQTGDYEVTCMGGTPDRNMRTCLRCGCKWWGYEYTAELVKSYIKRSMLFNKLKEKKDDMNS